MAITVTARHPALGAEVRGVDMREPLDDATVQAIGDAWLEEGAALLLRMPSVVVPAGWNYLLNPAHADARKVRTRRMVYRADPRLW